jgi:hypothetical protein
MERKLEYKIDSSSYADEDVKRFYSDLRPVLIVSTREPKRNSRSMNIRRFIKHMRQSRTMSLPEFGVPKVSQPLS